MGSLTTSRSYSIGNEVLIGIRKKTHRIKIGTTMKKHEILANTDASE